MNFICIITLGRYTGILYTGHHHLYMYKTRATASCTDESLAFVFYHTPTNLKLIPMKNKVGAIKDSSEFQN